MAYGAATTSLRAQPNDLVGFRLGQDISEIKAKQGGSLRHLQRGRSDQVLSGCGLETYRIEHSGERLEITALRGKVYRLDLSKDFDFLDPVATANNFVTAYGAPRRTACMLRGSKTELRALPKQCSRKQTFVELDYWRGEADPLNLVVLRVRLRAATGEFPKAHSRITLSLGWDARVEKLAACGEQAPEDPKGMVLESTRKGAVGPGTVRPWADPDLDDGWGLALDPLFIK